MKVEIWSDVVCPFCYIGKRKFEKALEGFSGRDEVSIEWKSFQLDPALDNSAGLSIHEYLAQRKGVSAADGKRMNDHMTAMAREVGLEYNFDKAVLNNTLSAHRLLHFAKKHGLQSELKERLFRAYYTEGRDVADTGTLVQLAVEVGLDAQEARQVLHEGSYADDVRKDQQTAYGLGVQGVPFFVFNSKYGVSGAQSPEVFAQVLQKVWDEERPTLIPEKGEGVCDIDGNCN